MKASVEASRGDDEPSRPAVAGNWTLHEVIGSGGSATVYRATRGDGEKSALKLMHAHLSGDRAWLRRVRREAALLKRIRNPGVARILDAGALPNGVPFIALELLEGRSLEVLRRERGGRLPILEALGYVRGVLRALTVVHALEIVHRDLKPSNVFVTTAGELKVLDFGIATVSETLSQADETASTTRGILGTPAYMAPEQARGRWDLVDVRSDLWSVGALLFTLISGEFVHVAGTENERLGLAMSRPARSLVHVVPEVGSALSAVLARALAYEQAERFQSADEFILALDGLEHRATSLEAAEATLVEAARPRARRFRPRLLVAAAALGSVAALALTLRARSSPAVTAAAEVRAMTSPAIRAAPPVRTPDPSLPPAVAVAATVPISSAAPPSRSRVPRASRASANLSPTFLETRRPTPAVSSTADDAFLGVRTGTRPPAPEPRADPLERRD